MIEMAELELSKLGMIDKFDLICKDIFDDEVHQISDEVWAKVVKTLDDESNLDFANQVISEEILEVLRENEVNA